MSNGPLRIEQYETVRYDINCNPLGVPDSVTRAIMENISAVGRYPDTTTLYGTPSLLMPAVCQSIWCLAAAALICCVSLLHFLHQRRLYCRSHQPRIMNMYYPCMVAKQTSMSWTSIRITIWIWMILLHTYRIHTIL